METVLPYLVSGLGAGLVAAAGKLAEKALVDPALETGLAPVSKWVTRGYDEKQDAEELRQAVLGALDELNAQRPEGDPERLIATLGLTGLTREQHAALAAAAIEMAHFDPAIIPPGLLASLGLDESRRDLLARFLYLLRERLGRSEKYHPVISYANDLDRQHQLAGLTQTVLDLQNQAARLVTLLEALTAERRLVTDDPRAFKEYLEWARQKWSSLMLPLIRERAGDIPPASLKQVFVPLQMRDVAAEQKARKEAGQMGQKKRPTEDPKDQPPPISLGELLNRYPRFLLKGKPGCGKTTLLHRAALAFAEGRATGDLGWQGQPLLPIFTRLRNFGVFLAQHKAKYPGPCPGALVDFLESQYRDGERGFLTPGFFDNRLKEGGCLVLLDGLDEVSDNRGDVAQHISEFIQCYGKYPGNRFGLSSRPRGYEMVELQLAAARLSVAEVLPLDGPGIAALVENLFTLIEPDSLRREDNTADLIKNLLGRPNLTELASTPLFCSALVQVYKYHRAHLPERTVEVLDEIVTLLLGFWRLQQSALVEAERLASEDGTGKRRLVEDAVKVKLKRLSYLAAQMQEKTITSINKDEAVEILAHYLKEREREKEDEAALEKAAGFLANAHEFSGLLAEHEPGEYSFLHKTFLEFLAATWLVDHSLVVPTAMQHLNDDLWEPVILMAGAHPKLPENFCSALVQQVLERAGDAADGGYKGRCLVMAGKLAADMAVNLPDPDREEVESRLLEGMSGPGLPAKLRAQVGAALSRLGDPRAEVLTLEAMPFCYVPEGPFRMGEGKAAHTVDLPAFWLAQYPVTNAQYGLFVQAKGYQEKHYWDEAIQAGYWKDGLFEGRWDNEGRSGPVDFGGAFGLDNHPVVGVSWYEALAFTRWLDELAHANGWLGKEWMVKLPSEAEWEKAARGGLRLPPNEIVRPLARLEGELVQASADNPGQERDYPWNGPFKAEWANTSESGIGATSAVGCFPGGAGPYGCQELSGNVWEWQENWYDKDEDTKALRGGSWYINQDDARCADRYWYYPVFRVNLVGFRCSLSRCS